jgi:peptide/nickel transport system permease protein
MTRSNQKLNPANSPATVAVASETGAIAAAEIPGSKKKGRKSVGRRFEFLYFAFRNKKLIFGLSVVSICLLIAIFGPFFAKNSPNVYTTSYSAKPSSHFWLGTNMFGQDVYAQFAAGMRSAFLVGVLGGAIAAIVGMLVGFTAGYRAGIVDEVLSMVTNIFLVIPVFAVLLVVAGFLHNLSVPTEALLIGLLSWPWAARALRAQTFSLVTRDFIGMARLSAQNSWRIIFKEIAPNMSSYLFMMFILLFGGAILLAALIDFIGLGPSTAYTLGKMMNDASNSSGLLLGMWWWFIPPGIAITAIVGGLYIMNVGLDEVFNPKLREM